MDNLFCVDDLTPSFPQVEVRKAQTEEQALGESLVSAKVTPLIKETKGRQGLRSAGVLHHINYNWRNTAVCTQFLTMQLHDTYHICFSSQN